MSSSIHLAPKPLGLAAPGRRTAVLKRWFFFGMAVAAGIAVLAGFYPTFLRPLAMGEFSARPLVYLHAAAFFGWMGLLLVQPLLVRFRRVDLHRKVGYGGAALAILMLATGTMVALGSASRGVAAGAASARPFLLITLTDMLLFGVLVGCAIWFRSRPQAHKRLMLLATAALLPAAFGRLFGIGFGIDHPLAMHIGADAFLLAGIAHDLWTSGRIHRAYMWGGGLLILVHTLRLLLADSTGWLVIADWILSVI